MEIRVLKKSEHKIYFDEILEMLICCDNEFVPPLSTRKSTTQTKLNGTKMLGDGIASYFEEMNKQKILIATENEKVIAFVAFRENFTNEKIPESELPNIYISTLIVHPEERGKKLTQKIYATLFDEYKTANVFTRTWSTNLAHIRILSKFNFERVCVIENDRGEGIDTFYFKKPFETV